MALGIRLVNDFAYKKTFGDPVNRQALVSLLNAILELKHSIEDVEIQNPFNDKFFEDDKLSILDIKAKDASGAIYNIEMQISVSTGLEKRMAFYACELFASQLKEGDNYSELRPVFVICLLNDKLWAKAKTAHHRFCLEDRKTGRQLQDTLEIHFVELPKYNLGREQLAYATAIERWAFLFQFSQLFTADELREMFPEGPFQSAISAIEAIHLKKEYFEMYETREKALRDIDWKVSAARDEGLKEGQAIGNLIGAIRTCQLVLSMTQSSIESLQEKPLDELQQLANSLQIAIRNRIT